MRQPLDILCLCHLPWEETLFQRPQQLMRRMAERGHRVTYVAQWGIRRAAREWRAGGLRRWRGNAIEGRLRYVHLPYAPGADRHAASQWASMAMMRVVMRRFFGRRNLARDAQATGKHGQDAHATGGFEETPRILWIYHPNHLRLLAGFRPDLLVYDCMDHFAGFRSEKRDVAERERALAQRAALVFTGGRSLHASKKDFNPRTYCFPSGVEFDHFARAAAPEARPPDDLAAIPRPRLGYFGAVDERIDWPLIRAICRARPDWHVVFLGPLVLMNACPVEEPNFHHLGPKPYATLPDYLSGFDVCLMPFVQSELVAHISPTKTPEYLAGGRPVVSSPVPDVIADYADDVAVAATPDAFIAACETAIARGAGPPRKPPASRTWDEIVDEVERLVFDALTRR